jgi:hypothetical protein
MGWIGRLVRRQMGIEGLEREAAQVAARANILARADEDRRRTPREDDVAPVARWRWVAGRWERWSFIEEGFVPDDPPQTLLDHLAAADGPRDGQELRLVDGTWRAADEEPAAPPVDPSLTDRPAPDGAKPTLQPADEGGAGLTVPAAEVATREPAQATDVAAQIEAWRRRST